MFNSKPSVLICGYDFEQKNYRGISFYSKSIVRAFHELTYSSYILTSSRHNKVDLVQEASIAKNLEDPRSEQNLSRFLSAKNAVELLLNYLKLMFPFQPGIPRLLNRGFTFELASKLYYLNDIIGYANYPYIYDLHSVHCQFFSSPYFINSEGFDAVFSTAPLSIKVSKKTRLVQTLHDAIPIFRADNKDDERAFYRRLNNMFIHSDAILSVSEFSRQEALKLFPDYKDKIATVYQPVPIYEEEEELANNPLIQKAVLRKFALNQLSYLLYIGRIEKRKNIERLVEAYLAVHDKIEIPLVLVGPKGFNSDEILKILSNKWINESTEKSIKYLSYVSNIDKLVLLKNALAFVFPSMYEGFGLPPLEAMKMGCPVLTSNVTSLPEVCGNAVLYVDPYDTASVIDGLLQISSNSELRRNLIQLGLERVKCFSLENFKLGVAHLLAEH